jgi:hypothetical protein
MPFRPFPSLVARGKARQVPGMSATLTIRLEAEVLRSAEQEAKARHTTLPEVVAQQLRVMARNWEDSHAGRLSRMPCAGR